MSFDPYPSPRDPSPFPWDPSPSPRRNPYPHPPASARPAHEPFPAPFPPTPPSPSYAAHPRQPSAPPAQEPRRTPLHPPLGHHSDLRHLRSAYRWQRRTATLTALGYFVLFLVLSAFAPSFMTGTVTGEIPTGLLLALLQVPVTWLAIAMYEGTARRRVDPLADLIRRQAALDAKREATR
ncbi:DUF485 domain-containing protein [Streptomyces sp. Tu 3180]|uniref:DUF485 domain-containing protein n=1 Tax=Streptomyces sp. Tu 3180 TaxID=2682611 RepID=UPI001357EC21|nr:DUF485 domain-containing protein [Streptomyces sp. Tu 3180]KAF3465843.1 DUF485 domain-containing protein [Streptomyces sp. Tu 3180]